MRERGVRTGAGRTGYRDAAQRWAVRAGLAAILGLATAGQAAAQVVPSVEPGAIQQEQRTPVPRIPEPLPSLSIPESGVVPPNAAEIVFELRDIRIDGSTVYDAGTLKALHETEIGRTVSLYDVYALATAIMQRYARDGYPLAIAILPAQEIEDGIVRIEVIEGYVSEIEIRGEDPNGEIAALLSGITEVRPLTDAALSRYLLLANDRAGVTARATFARSEAGRGATKLIVDVTRRAFEGSIAINNRGSRAIGPWRAEAELHANGVLGADERLSLRLAQSSQTEELTYLGAGIAVPVGGEGTVITLDGTWSQSEPGTATLTAIDFMSDGWTATLGVSHPFVRTREMTLRGFGRLGIERYSSDILGVVNSEDQLTLATVGGSLDWLGWPGGRSTLSASITQGLDLFEAIDDNSPLKSRPLGSAVFTTANLEAGHLQALGRQLDLYVLFAGQYASRQLLAPSQCGAGGTLYGRAYDNYEIAGDHCLKGSAELRYWLPDFGLPVTGWHLYGFYDGGLVWQKGSLPAGVDRSTSLVSVGGGARASFTTGTDLSLEVAKPLTRDVALEGDDDIRFFVSLSQRF